MTRPGDMLLARRTCRHVEVEQVVHIPPNGPAVHAEPAGEFGHRPDAGAHGREAVLYEQHRTVGEQFADAGEQGS